MNRWIGAIILSLSACAGTTPAQPLATPWESVQVAYQDATVVREKVSYRSGGLRINGQVCHPNRTGRFPVLLWNHGGFEGLQAGDEAFCQVFAGFGYTVLMSSYRGENASEGGIEVCQGEVDDVLRMLELGRGLPYTNPASVAVMGGSHGGCISLRAVQRGAPAQVLVDFYGPSDWAAEYQQIQRLVASSDATKQFVGKALDAVVTSALGGTPAQVPQQYTLRSPRQYAASLSNWSGALLIVHGVQDWFVLPSQSCDLAANIGGFSSYRIDASNTVVASAPSGCEAAGLKWTGAALPKAVWSEQRYLLVYDRLAHGNGDQRDLAIADALDFVTHKLPPQ